MLNRKWIAGALCVAAMAVSTMARAEASVSATQAMETTSAVAMAAAAGGGTQAVDTLAGWLLTQAGMTEGAAR